MPIIKKIKLKNFRRFKSFEVEFNESMNILIGDNESGKSTILNAIDIVLSGSRSKIENIGLDNLFNVDVINSFMASERKLVDIPILFIELYLSEQEKPELNGKYNSDDTVCDGLAVYCEPNDTLSDNINDILQQDDPIFPFEYYSINFKTFSGDGFTGYRNYLRHLLIDNSQIGSEYATREYVKTIYNSNVLDAEKNKHQNEYRRYKEKFKTEILEDINQRVQNYNFTVRTSSKSCLENDLTISEEEINIENKGKGKQCFIKTEFALQKQVKGRDLDVILLEEPENHLSHINMKKLIRKINDSSENQDKQLFITTHSDLICARLDLRNAIILNSNNTTPLKIKNLKEDTSKFFMKAPNSNILEFILSKKVIMVEGDSEYILMDLFFKKTANCSFEDSDVNVISVGGTSFKRYLDLSSILDIKTAVVRDNDSNFQANCIDSFSDYEDKQNIKIFFDTDNSRSTFEIILYQDNMLICETLFSNRRSLNVQDYMLKNKTETAFKLLLNSYSEIIVPTYVKKAIEWIKE